MNIFSTIPGTEMHIDPAATDAYNTCILGHKAWVYLPRDMYEYYTEWSCDESCSPGMPDKLLLVNV